MTILNLIAEYQTVGRRIPCDHLPICSWPLFRERRGAWRVQSRASGYAKNIREFKMKRKNLILKHISKEQRGIEIGPWFSPLAAKKDGFNSLVLDVFDKDRLIENAIADPAIPDDRVPCIEDVDLLGTSTEIEQLIASRNELGTFDYVVSSHNFEHLPNPIKFLQGCGRVLKAGGMLSMAIPDKRVCFDIFRPASTLGQWIEAYFENRDKPSLAQIFEHHASFAEFNRRAPYASEASTSLKGLYAQWLSSAEDVSPRKYQDAHCWVFTPASFELMIRDAKFLGISPFSVVSISKSKGNEFFVHLRNEAKNLNHEDDASAHFSQRQRVLSRMAQEAPYILSLSRRIGNMLRKRA